MHRTLAATTIAAVLIAPGAASAQSTAWGDSGYISLNGMYEPGTQRYETVTPQDINLETVTITATHGVGRRPVFDLTVGGRVKGNLGLGFGIAYARGTKEARVAGPIPHPFYFDQPRPLDAGVELERTDLALHIHSMWLLPLTERMQVAVFGGPTWFRITQQTIASVSVEDSYPFDAVSLADTSLEDRRASHFGFNVGFDASYFFSRYLGLHGLARYAQGTVVLGSSGSGTSVDVGGLQVGAGLRIRY
jgi:hypothetical protein